MTAFRPKTRTATAVEATDPIMLDFNQPSFEVSLTITGSATTPTGDAEYTADDPRNFTSLANFSSTANWVAVGGTDLSGTLPLQSNIAFPVTAVRLNVTGGSSINLTLTTVQSGPHR